MQIESPETGGTRIPVNIEDEMRDSYLAYAMSVIMGRALPDVRDGLKPVHRRALYAMYEQRNFYNTAYKKSARIVGDVIGKYHPHGDSAVYDTIVRMAQDFSMRYPLVDGQGNFGSVDGDPPAAMRYTEVRMTRLAGSLLADLDKETVDFQPNYDGADSEPEVLPAAFPNLLVNGSGGIAVGMATNMPPHNLGEVIDATIKLIESPDVSVDELLEIVPGPDFPTAGFIYGRSGIEDAYRTGRGIIKMRARATVETDERGDDVAIVVTELPYQVNKARLLERIAQLVRDKKIMGIRDLRDESDRRGMRMYIELKRGVMGQIVLNQLYKQTAMQSSFGIINLAIVDGQPRVLTLKELLSCFVNHRRDVVSRRCRYELRKAEERAHILEGYLIALGNIDEVIRLIKASATPAEARDALTAAFELSRVQAQSILDMRLQRLTALEVDKIRQEHAELLEEIGRLKAILESEPLLMAMIVEELREVSERYADARRTVIVEASSAIGMEDLIADEDMVVTITTTGYIKRTPLTQYRTQRRGGRGRSGMSTKTEDTVTNLFVASAHTLLMIFTDRGQVYPLKVWELPQGEINARGKPIVNLIPELEKDEIVRSVVPVDSLDRDDQFLVFVTRNGVVKRTMLSQYKNVRTSGIRAIVLEDDNDLITVFIAQADHQVMLATARGQSIIFPLSNVRATGRATMGVRGIRLRAEDYVVAADVLASDMALEVSVEDDGESPDGEAMDSAGASAEDLVEDDEELLDEESSDDTNEPSVLLVTVNGYGKRTPVSKFRVQKRGGLGLRALPYHERNGELVSMCYVRAEDDVMVVTDGGTIIRVPVADVRSYSRQARGVRIITPGKGETVVSVHTVDAEEDEVDLPHEGEDGETGDAGELGSDEALASSATDQTPSDEAAASEATDDEDSGDGEA